MGAWDVTAFGNDDAADWAAELTNAHDPLECLHTTLSLGKDHEYLEAPDACQMIAAAAVVAAARGTAVTGMPPDLSYWVGSRQAAIKPLNLAALVAVERVKGADSELQDLWAETDNYIAWCADVDRITAGLR